MYHKKFKYLWKILIYPSMFKSTIITSGYVIPLTNSLL